jgi:hypothetical protein
MEGGYAIFHPSDQLPIKARGAAAMLTFSSCALELKVSDESTALVADKEPATNSVHREAWSRGNPSQCPACVLTGATDTRRLAWSASTTTPYIGVVEFGRNQGDDLRTAILATCLRVVVDGSRPSSIVKFA